MNESEKDHEKNNENLVSSSSVECLKLEIEAAKTNLENSLEITTQTQTTIVTELKETNTATTSQSTISKKCVRFSDVKLYMFDRTQGFECVPSDNANKTITLGMSPKHTDIENFNNLDDYLKYKRLKHLQKLEEELNKSLNENYENSAEEIVNDYDDDDDEDDEENDEDTEENNLFYQSQIEEKNKILEIITNKKNYEDINVDLPINMDFFCPILSPIERRRKLYDAGLDDADIDETECEEIVAIKQSREFCGCKCSKLGLDCSENGGNECSCFANGIACQLDKARYPCDCTVKKCKNSFGLKKFDQRAVLKHYKNVLSKNIFNENEQLEEQSKTLKKIPKVSNTKKRKRKKTKNLNAATTTTKKKQKISQKSAAVI